MKSKTDKKPGGEAALHTTIKLLGILNSDREKPRQSLMAMDKPVEFHHLLT